jgi:hypothetical protein
MKKLLVFAVTAILLSFGTLTKADCAVVPTDGDTKGVVNSMNVTVPNVIGLLGGKGRAAIENAGLKWVYATQGIPTPDPNKNAIIARQSPEAGTVVFRYSTVTLTLYIFSERYSDGDTKGSVRPLGR